MPYVEWDLEKSKKLLDERGVSFNDILTALGEGKLIMIDQNPAKDRIHQFMLVVEIGGYVYTVPFIDDGEKWFLKTIVPSRKYTKKYLTNKKRL